MLGSGISEGPLALYSSDHVQVDSSVRTGMDVMISVSPPLQPLGAQRNVEPLLVLELK
jgi:hypothetical protein